MQLPGMHHVNEWEKALAEGLRDLATELRLIDVVEFVTYIRMEKLAHIESLVNSAAEIHFKPGTLRFAASAELRIDWGAAPTIGLDLEFANRGVVVHFSLALESCRAGIEINDVIVDGVRVQPLGDACRLTEAMEDARADLSFSPQSSSPGSWVALTVH